MVVSEGGFVTRAWAGASVYTEAEQKSWLLNYVRQARSRSLPFANYELFDNVGYFGLSTPTPRRSPWQRRSLHCDGPAGD